MNPTYELCEDDSIHCLNCGDKVVSPASHDLFCKGFSKEPWTALPLSAERIAYWRNHQKDRFEEWAKKNRVELPVSDLPQNRSNHV